MGKKRFVTAGTVRLELSDGDWIEVKERLTYGEQQHLTNSALGRVQIGSSDVPIDMETWALARFETWLVDWSFVDENEKRVAVSKAAIRNLDQNTAAEIEQALTAHIEALEKKA